MSSDNREHFYCFHFFGCANRPYTILNYKLTHEFALLFELRQFLTNCHMTYKRHEWPIECPRGWYFAVQVEMVQNTELDGNWAVTGILIVVYSLAWSFGKVP